MKRYLSVLLVVLLVSACGNSSREDLTGENQVAPVQVTKQPPNILILVADDLGVDSMGMFGAHERNATTANLDALASQGMRYDRFWTQPVCSPMRVTSLTGRYTFRHGVGGPLWSQSAHLGVPQPADPEGTTQQLDFSPMGVTKPGASKGPRKGPNTEDPPPGAAPKGPSTDELMIPAVLKGLPTPYATAAIGKWHMADRENGWLNHPNNVEFDYFSGPLAGDIKSFFAWQHVENGKPRQEFGYIDQHSVNDALRWINDQSEEQPWFMWFSFINPHEPFHKPPVDLIQSENLKKLDPNGLTVQNTPTYFKAQVEAMDSLVGQLLAGIPEEQRNNTYIFWLGDNGDENWAREVKDRKPNRFKMTNYEGGAHVPFIAAGPGIPANSVNSSLAHVVDLFSTVIELAGGNPAELAGEPKIDSVSMRSQLLAEQAPLRREWNYTDVDLGKFAKGPASAIRNGDYKLISSPGAEEFYHLPSDPEERNNLVDNMDTAALENYLLLKQQLMQLKSTESN